MINYYHLLIIRLRQTNAEDVIFRLVEEEVITNREARIMLSVIDRSVFYIDLPHRDELEQEC